MFLLFSVPQRESKDNKLVVFSFIRHIFLNQFSDAGSIYFGLRLKSLSSNHDKDCSERFKSNKIHH